MLLAGKALIGPAGHLLHLWLSHTSTTTTLLPLLIVFHVTIQASLDMRSATFLIACAAVVRAAAAPSNCYLYTIDQSVTSSATQFIDSTLASSIVARRRGLTDSRYLNIDDAYALNDLNAYGGWQQPLFGQSVGEAPGKLFIRISGFDGGQCPSICALLIAHPLLQTGNS